MNNLIRFAMKNFSMKAQLFFIIPNPIISIIAQIDTNERSTNKTDENLYIIKNREDIIPFDRLNRNIRNLSFIDGKQLIGEKLNLFFNVDTFHVNHLFEDYDTLKSKVTMISRSLHMLQIPMIQSKIHSRFQF